MATEAERKALIKQKAAELAAKNKSKNEKIKQEGIKKQKQKDIDAAKKKQQIQNAIGNTATKAANDKLDKEISLGKIKARKGKPQTTKETIKTARQTASQRVFGNGPDAKKSNTNNTKNNNTKNNNKPGETDKNGGTKTKRQVRNIGKSVGSVKSSGVTTPKSSRTITGQILTGKPKKRTEGEIRTRKQNQNRIDGGGLNSYKQGDKRANYNATSKEELANMTPQQRRIAKRTNKRLDRKEGRKNDRARNVAIRKGLSPQQAKDFMQNRRNRLNQAMGEFGKGLMGKEQNLGNIDKRLYRKKGTGTLQNMKAKDGSTYDATAPYKGVGPNRTGRGLAKTYYEGLVKTKPLDLDPTIKLNKPSQNDSEGKNKVTKQVENQLEGEQGNNLSTKLYSDMPESQRASASAYNINKYGTDSPTAEGKANNTFNYKDGERAQGLDKYNERLKKASGINKLDDRSTMQGNMMNAKGRR